MSRTFITIVALSAIATLSACGAIGKGKGKAPPPAPVYEPMTEPVYKD